MDLVLLKKLMKMVDESTINDFELETEGIKIKLSKGQNAPVYAPPQIHSQIIPQQIITRESSAEPQLPDDTSDLDSGLYEIKSPIVGTFYKAPSPDSLPFVEVGEKISVGTTLCIIEAMKLMNEIESDVNGTVAKVFVENGSAVEYGQPLFLIKVD